MKNKFKSLVKNHLFHYLWYFAFIFLIGYLFKNMNLLEDSTSVILGNFNQLSWSSSAKDTFEAFGLSDSATYIWQANSILLGEGFSYDSFNYWPSGMAILNIALMGFDFESPSFIFHSFYFQFF